VIAQTLQKQSQATLKWHRWQEEVRFCLEYKSVQNNQSKTIRQGGAGRGGSSPHCLSSQQFVGVPGSFTERSWQGDKFDIKTLTGLL
jgi:hypothetical protein